MAEIEQLTVNVELLEAPRVTLVGLNVAPQPVGAPVAVKVTIPVKPLTGPTVMVEVADCPAMKLMDVGVAVTKKSVTRTETVAMRVSPPPVPVTVRVKDAEFEQATVSVEVPEVPSVTLVGLSVAVQPAGAPVAVREIVPVNPLTAAKVMVNAAEEPATKVSDAGLAVMVKSVTVTATVAEWDSAPLIPVMVTTKFGTALEQLTVKVDVPDTPSVTLAALNVAVQPAGVPVAARVTVPMKPLTAATVIVEAAEAPALKLIAVGPAVTVKSGAPPTDTWTVTEWDNAPGLVPVTVTMKLVTAGVEAQATVSVEA